MSKNKTSKKTSNQKTTKDELRSNIADLGGTQLNVNSDGLGVSVSAIVNGREAVGRGATEREALINLHGAATVLASASAPVVHMHPTEAIH